MGFTFKDAFPQRFLRADDVAQPLTLSILRVLAENIRGETKPVAYFSENELGLILNQTLFRQIVEITGCDDTDDWVEHRITLFRDVIKVNNRTIPCISARRTTRPQAAPKVLRAQLRKP